MTEARTGKSNDYVKTVRELMGWDQDEFSDWTVGSDAEPAEVSASALPVSDLPVTDMPDDSIEDELDSMDESQEVVEEQGLEEVDTSGLKTHTQGWLSKDYVRYPAIFVIALSFFYVILNFGAVSSQVSSIIVSPPENEEAVLGESLPEYNSWISKYYYHVGNPAVLAANNDADSDGLTNIEEFYLRTNPLRADTDGDGLMDGNEIAQNTNPLYFGSVTAKQQTVIAEHVDVESIPARQNFQSQVAGSGTSNYSSNNQNYVVYNSVNDFIVDTTREGRIDIPKLGVSVPLVWNKNFDWVQDDLKHGVVHHPDTPIPGSLGMVSIHGHSSGYIWDGNHKNAFTKLNFLEAGDEVLVTVYSSAGDERVYRYLVQTSEVYEVEDPGQFAPQGGYHMNLSTSWPIGTAKQRFVVTTELGGIVR